MLVLQKVLQENHLSRWHFLQRDTMVNTSPWQGIMQSNLKHKKLIPAAKLPGVPSVRRHGVLQGTKKEKLEAQDTEISTSRKLRVAMKQGSWSPLLSWHHQYLEVNPVKQLGCHSWEFGIPLCWWDHLYLESCPALHEPLLQLHLSQTTRVLSLLSQDLASFHSTNASEMTKKMGK